MFHGGGGGHHGGGGGGGHGGGGGWGRRNFPGRGFGWGLPVVYDYLDDDDDDVYEVVNVNGEADEDVECNMAGEIVIHHKRRKPYALVG